MSGPMRTLEGSLMNQIYLKKLNLADGRKLFHVHLPFVVTSVNTLTVAVESSVFVFSKSHKRL
jgi:hypothetical protein